MNFREKLTRRVAQLGLNKSKASRDAGLPDSTISAYLAKEDSLPRLDIAAKIAKAIRVPLEWLADDSTDWPPPDAKVQASPRQFSDRDLMLEVASRYRLSLLRLLEFVEAAEKIKWDDVLVGKEPKPKNLQQILMTLAISGTLSDLYNVEAFTSENADLLPGDAIPNSSAGAIGRRIERLNARYPFLQERIWGIRDDVEEGDFAALVPTDFREPISAEGKRRKEELIARLDKKSPAAPPVPPASQPPASPAAHSSTATPNESTPKVGAPKRIIVAGKVYEGAEAATMWAEANEAVRKMFENPPQVPESVEETRNRRMPLSSPPSPAAPSASAAPHVKPTRKRETKPQKTTLQPHSKEAK